MPRDLELDWHPPRAIPKASGEQTPTRLVRKRRTCRRFTVSRSGSATCWNGCVGTGFTLLRLTDTAGRVRSGQGWLVREAAPAAVVTAGVGWSVVRGRAHPPARAE